MKTSVISTEAFGTGVGVLLGQGLPPVLGYPVARLIAHAVGLFPRGAAFCALRLNQWIVSGKQLTGKSLDKAVRQVFLNQATALYDFYHALDRPRQAEKQVSFTPAFSRLVEECKRGGQPTILLTTHLSGFNLGGLRMAQQGLKFLTLAVPNPTRGYTWQNELRNRRGLEVVPFTVEALGLARERLKAGGTVLTGIDRPMANPTYTPRFFGHPSALPVAYIRLALKSAARVFVVGFTTREDHTYEIDASEQVMMEPGGADELVRNAEAVLRRAEEFIRRDPRQWMMFFPVWPGELGSLAGAVSGGASCA